MRRLVVATLATLAVWACPAVAVADDNNPRKQSPSGAFNPTFDHSPVIICATKDACRFAPPRGVAP